MDNYLDDKCIYIYLFLFSFVLFFKRYQKIDLFCLSLMSQLQIKRILKCFVLLYYDSFLDILPALKIKNTKLKF